MERSRHRQPLLVVVVVVLSSALLSGCRALITHTPEYIKPCPRSSPNAGGCLERLLQELFPYLARGIPELGVLPYEPLHIAALSLSKGQGAVVLQGSFRDVRVQGPSQARVTSARLSLDQPHALDFSIALPQLSVTADYDLKGHVLVLPLLGSGKATLNIQNATTRVSTRFVLQEQEGREVIKVVSMKVDFDIGAMNLHLSNLFNGNKVLGHTVNAFLNKNAQEVVADLKEPLGESLSGVFIGLINQIFLNVPLDIWLPRDP